MQKKVTPTTILTSGPPLVIKFKGPNAGMTETLSKLSIGMCAVMISKKNERN
jgi:hypothetical protein